MNELTREQVEEVFNAVYWHGDQQGAKQCKVLDGIDALRATITQQAQELGRVKREFVNKDQIIASLAEQLTASQARCREMERELAQVTGKCKGLRDIVDIHNSLDTVPRSRYDVCNQDWLDEKAKCQRVVENATVEINRLEQQLAQLQAHAAGRREGRIEHLEGVLKFVGVSEDADSIIMDMKKYHASHRCKDHMDDPWRGIDTEIYCFVCLKQQRDAAVQGLKRLQLTWTTERPTVAGKYWWRSPHRGDEVAYIFMGGGKNRKRFYVSYLGLDESPPELDHVLGEWAGPIPMPTEPQQARGSSGGDTNHGAGT